MSLTDGRGSTAILPAPPFSPTVETQLGEIRDMCQTMANDLATMAEDERDDSARANMRHAQSALLDARGATRIALRRHGDAEKATS